jgi:hypothetical protein
LAAKTTDIARRTDASAVNGCIPLDAYNEAVREIMPKTYRGSNSRPGSVEG